MVSELLPNTDWQNENRLARLKKSGLLHVDLRLQPLSLSSAFLNSDLLATSGATPGACIASV